MRGASVMSAGSYSGGGDRISGNTISSALGNVISYGKGENGSETLPQ